MKSALAWSIAVLVILVPLTESSAQIFGQRETGQPVVRRTSPSISNRDAAAGPTPNRTGTIASRSPAPVAGGERPALESLGTIVDENARFVRGNREATDFVGTDAGETSRFVGSQQTGLGELVESAIDEALTVDTGADLNRAAVPVMPPRLLLNTPRLQLGFASRPLSSADVSATVRERLRGSIAAADPRLIEVSVAEGVATIRGRVASERDRKLAAILAGFEPGVARVVNELTVAGWDSERAAPARSSAAD